MEKLERKVRLATLTLVALGLVIAGAAAVKSSDAPADGRDLQAESVVPLPLAGVTILVDAGHGGYDGGARARDSGVWEKEINLAVALETEKALAAQGAKVVMTRRTDKDLCEEKRPAALTKKRQDMQNRIALAEENGADMVLSIHMNEYRDRRESGPQVFYRKGSDAGRLLAGCLQETLIASLQPQKTRSALDGDYFILQLDVPSALIECGFISNAGEEKLLLSGAYQQRLAQGIAAGVMQYFSLQQAVRHRSTSVP